MRNLIATFKLLSFGLLCLAVVPPQLLILKITKGKISYILPHLWEKAVCFIFRIQKNVIGIPKNDSQVIYVSNHLSYLDIPLIGSVIKGSFVAKQDVSGWPVFGFLSKLQQTAFISRNREDAANAAQNLENMLIQGKSLIIFPEGTSTDGRDVHPFKSSLFSLFFKESIGDIFIQPITIKMIKTNAKTVTSQEDRDLYAWHINMDTPLGEHLWQFAKSKGAEIEINIHPAFKAHSLKNRKELAKHCHDTVCKAL